jgi:hypothetical protein
MMRLDKTLGAAALVSAVAGLIWWASSSTSKVEPGRIGTPRAPFVAPVAPGPAPSPPSDSSQQEAIQRLEARLAQVEMLEHSAPKDKDSPVEKRDDTPPPVDPRVAADRLAEGYDAALAAESVDRVWDAAMQTRLEEFFESDMAAGSSLQRVDCRSTMCRVEVTSQSTKARDAFTQTMSHMSPPNSQGFAHIETDESLDFVIYLSRENQPLPPQAM